MELIKIEEKKMSVNEIALAFGVTTEAIKKHVREMFPDCLRNGAITLLTEYQVTEIKKKMIPTTRVVAAVTDLEMEVKAMEVMEWMGRKIKTLQEQLSESNRKNAILMHVSKTYTASEIAKELGLRSAQELNQAMSDCKIQYKVNGTWLPSAQYSECGYFIIKQQELDNGKVIYDRKITQLGREFLIEQFKAVK